MNDDVVRIARMEAGLSEDGQALVLETTREDGGRLTLTLPRAELAGLIAALLPLERELINQIDVDQGGPEGP